MKSDRFKQITARYASLRVAIVGDFCLDRYFDIDPARQEISIETGLPVHNIVRVRCQPGAAGTILNNLVALGVGKIFPIGICGDDGEGFELRRSLEARAGIDVSLFVKSSQRRTFTYTKPLVFDSGKPPEELSRLDIKNWSATPEALQNEVIAAMRQAAPQVDAMILLDQVDVAETGVITGKVLQAARSIIAEHPNLFVIADSRRGLKEYPQVALKMNRAELAAMAGHEPREIAHIRKAATHIAASYGKPVFITLAERGIIGAAPGREAIHRDALPLRGEIDIVGAGDSVTANLTAALAAGADIEQAIELAMAASSIVIHQLGTTGTASVPEIESLMAGQGLLV